MFIQKINAFLPDYPNFSKEQFERILDISNQNDFNIHKLEKDFLLTLILIKFSKEFPNLIFKGGTCLNKVYFPYFRLSEDLDFVVDAQNMGRTARKTLLKRYENEFVKKLSILGLKLQDGRSKFDEHKLAFFSFEYKSVIDGSKQTIKIDLSLKYNLILPPKLGIIKSVFKNPVFEEDIFDQHKIKVMDLKEMLAEKIRASLTRSQPTIRDFFDIWYIKNKGNIDFNDEEFKEIVKVKLEEVGFRYTLDGNYQNLRKQIKVDLEPVLAKNFDFDFDEVYKFVQQFKI